MVWQLLRGGGTKCIVRHAGKAARANAERGARGNAHRRLVQEVDEIRHTQADGYFTGKITASLGREWQVNLHDGRQVKAKAAGKLTRPGGFQPLRVGNNVTIRYSLDEDEDAQTPMIVQRNSLHEAEGEGATSSKR